MVVSLRTSCESDRSALTAFSLEAEPSGLRVIERPLRRTLDTLDLSEADCTESAPFCQGLSNVCIIYD